MICSMVPFSFSADKIPTKIIVRVVSKDAKIIGSGVGGALVRIKNLETGEILAADQAVNSGQYTLTLRISP